MGGYRDDGYDEDGYDESQRAEILEATRGGPGDGTIQIDLDPDLGEDPDALDEDDDDIAMALDEGAAADGDDTREA
jgi:hypothetical protein